MTPASAPSLSELSGSAERVLSMMANRTRAGSGCILDARYLSKARELEKGPKGRWVYNSGWGDERAKKGGVWIEG